MRPYLEAAAARLRDDQTPTAHRGRRDLGTVACARGIRREQLLLDRHAGGGRCRDQGRVRLTLVPCALAPRGGHALELAGSDGFLGRAQGTWRVGGLASRASPRASPIYWSAARTPRTAFGSSATGGSRSSSRALALRRSLWSVRVPGSSAHSCSRRGAGRSRRRARSPHGWRCGLPIRTAVA